MDISHANNKWLALGMLRSGEVMAMVLQRLSLQDFREDESVLKVAFTIGSRWHVSNKSEVPYEVSLSVFSDELMPNRVLSDEQALEFGELLYWAYFEVNDVKDKKNYILDILQKFILDRKIRPAAAMLDRQQNIVESLQELNKTVARSTLTKAKFIDPFGSACPLLNSTKRVPWGVDWMDTVTSGGAMPGETTLVLAPSGGGKTLTNVQMATTAALQGEDAMIITYEQSALSITNRIYAFAMGMSISTFTGLSQEDFKNNRSLQEKYDKACSRLSGKLTIVDQMQAAQEMAGGGSGGAAEVETIVKQAQDNGRHPRYVGVDWLGPMANNYMGARNMSTAEQSKVMNAMADELRKVGDRLQVNIFIYHQLGTAAAEGGARRKPEATDAYMCRTLHHYMDTVVCIGNRDRESNLAWVNAPKVRNGQPFQDMLIQMDGAMSRWKPVDRSEVNPESMKFYGQGAAAVPQDEEAPGPRKTRKDPLAFSESVRAHLG